MKKRNDEELLRAWSKDRCEESFRVLVDRYTDLVFGTAARRMGDRRLAEEVSQNVFIALAKKAERIKGENGIGGWLFKTTVLEAAGMRRSESRRDHRMRELDELEETLRRVGGEAMGGEALEIVDEGLAGLGASDRDALMARFFNGASYEEMAQQTGRSEAACRKQVSRALEKLADAIGARGVRVSGAVLAASLGAMMSTKAPAGLAGTCASTALAASAGAVAPGILTTILRGMSASKVTGIVAIGSVLLLASTGTAYLVGRERAKKEAAPSAGGKLVQTEPANPAKSSGSGPASITKSRTGPLWSEDPQTETRAEAVVNALKRELRGKGWSHALEVGPPLAEPLQASDLKEAFALIGGENDASLRQTVEAVLYGRWGSLDAKYAIEHALTQESEFMRRVALERIVPAWAATDPEGALVWHAEFVGQDELPVDEASANRLLGILLKGWAAKDVDAAWDAFEGMGADQQRAALHEFGNLIGRPEHREAMGRRIAVISEEPLRSRVAEEVGEAWARIDPQGAADWFQTVEFEDPMLRLRAAMEIGEGWFESDPAAAADWLWPMLPEQMRSRFVKELAESPFGRDRPAFEDWLQKRGYNPDKEEQE